MRKKQIKFPTYWAYDEVGFGLSATLVLCEVVAINTKTLTHSLVTQCVRCVQCDKPRERERERL